jgi:hypothetical protein
VIVEKTFVRLFCAKVFDGISPKNITHQSVGGRFAESIKLSVIRPNCTRSGELRAYFTDIIKGIQFWRKAAMYAEKLLVHNCRQRKGTERLHACFINTFGILVLAYDMIKIFIHKGGSTIILTFQLEGKVVC